MPFVEHDKYTDSFFIHHHFLITFSFPIGLGTCLNGRSSMNARFSTPYPSLYQFDNDASYKYREPGIERLLPDPRQVCSGHDREYDHIDGDVHRK